MEDNKLESLFANFDPDLPSEVDFLNKLQNNLTTVDIIRQEVADSHFINKKALVIGLVIGFTVGFLFSLLLPYLSDMVTKWQLTLANESFLNALATNFNAIAWTVVGITSVLAALNTYEVSLSLLTPKKCKTN